MAYCKNCGAEILDNYNYCPVCGYPQKDEQNGRFRQVNMPENLKKNLKQYRELTLYERNKISWEIITFIIFSAVVITTTIDFFTSHGISWSIYVISAGLLAFVNITVLFFISRKTLLKFILSFFSVAVYILWQDYFDKVIEKVTFQVILVVFVFYVIALVFVFAFRKNKAQIFNLIGLTLILIGFVNMAIDAIISLYQKHAIKLTWSLIVFVSTVLIALIMFYLNSKLQKSTDLRRFFHI